MTINPADCDRTTVYTGECRNFADTAWVRFDSGRRRASKPANHRAWLVDYGTASYWCRDDQVRNLVPLVPEPEALDTDALAELIRRAAEYGAQTVAHTIRDTLAITNPQPGRTLDEIDPRLVWLLRAAGNEWGPLGVARAAAQLVHTEETHP